MYCTVIDEEVLFLYEKKKEVKSFDQMLLPENKYVVKVMTSCITRKKKRDIHLRLKL